MIDKKVKLFIPFALVVAGIVGFVVWLSNHSYINIVVNDNIGENNITYIISGSTSSVNKNSKKKKLKGIKSQIDKNKRILVSIKRVCLCYRSIRIIKRIL